MYTAKVNIRAQEERERREKDRLAKEAISKIKATTGPPQRSRKRKGLNFHQPGTFVAQGEQLRKKARLEALKKKIGAVAQKTGITDDVKLATLTTNKVVETKTPVLSDVKKEVTPEIEWWDKLLLRGKSLEEVVLRLEQKNAKPEEIFNGITDLIYHPAIKKPPGPDLGDVVAPLHLTKKELKKKRRQERKKLELAKQEQIKLGLLPQPEPKLKRSNIMFALGDEAIVNPSMAEQLVREQEEKRKQAHIEHNESKKLSLEQKRAKKFNKIKEDLNMTGTWVSIFRVLSLNSQANKFKISQNAKQLTMTGALVLIEDTNLVVVEGGPNQLRKFKHLMLHRIDWSQDPVVNSETSTDTHETNKCVLVWEGQVSERSFRGFKVKPMTSKSDARDFFKQLKVEHYWDLAVRKELLEQLESV